jgi:2-polyprenyl-6-hydroxyphenyl methylase/3-demethylubiquinone-9 3-methyltransferase
LRFKNAEAAARSGEPVRFSFGENWAKYLGSLTPEKVKQAEFSLAESFDGHGIAGETFLDFGCGSGLFSLCASRLGARSVTSVDVDPLSIACVTELRAGSAVAASWDVTIGSVLDADFVGALPAASRVYSWGVLHHTGAMWPALENLQTRVAPGGLLCLALYREPRHVWAHMFLKRLYNKSPRVARPLLAASYAGAWLGLRTVCGRGNPVSYVRNYGRNSRGMTFWRDVEDWLGGLPCEFAAIADVRSFLAHWGFEELRVMPGTPGGNAEYLFRRVAR